MSMTNSNANFLLMFVLFVLIGVCTAYYADRKGRNPTAWFIFGFLFGLLPLIILYFLPSLSEEDETSSTMAVSSPVVNPPAVPDLAPKQEVKAEEDKLWYYLDQNHQQYGPVSIIGLKDLWDTGQLELTSYVWSEGMEKWETVDHLPALKEAFKHYQG